MNPPHQWTSSGTKRKREEGDEFFASLASDPILHEYENKDVRLESNTVANDKLTQNSTGRKPLRNVSQDTLLTGNDRNRRTGRPGSDDRSKGIRRSSLSEVDETDSQAEFWRSGSRKERSSRDGNGKGGVNGIGVKSSSRSHHSSSTTQTITPTPDTWNIRAPVAPSLSSQHTTAALQLTPPISDQRHEYAQRISQQPNPHLPPAHPHLPPDSFHYHPPISSNPNLDPPPHPYIYKTYSQHPQHPHYHQHQAMPPPYAHPIRPYAGYHDHPAYIHPPPVFAGQGTAPITSNSSNNADMALKAALETSELLRQSLSSAELECQRLSALLHQEKDNTRVVRAKYEMEREERRAVQTELRSEREERSRTRVVDDTNLEIKVEDRVLQKGLSLISQKNESSEKKRSIKVWRRSPK